MAGASVWTYYHVVKVVEEPLKANCQSTRDDGGTLRMADKMQLGRSLTV